MELIQVLVAKRLQVEDGVVVPHQDRRLVEDQEDLEVVVLEEHQVLEEQVIHLQQLPLKELMEVIDHQVHQMQAVVQVEEQQ